MKITFIKKKHIFFIRNKNSRRLKSKFKYKKYNNNNYNTMRKLKLIHLTEIDCKRFDLRAHSGRGRRRSYYHYSFTQKLLN